MHFRIPDGVLAADILRRHQSIHDAFYFLRASHSSEKQNQSKEITEEIAKESRHGTLRLDLDRHRHRSDIISQRFGYIRDSVSVWTSAIQRHRVVFPELFRRIDNRGNDVSILCPYQAWPSSTEFWGGKKLSYDDFEKLVALVALVFCCTHVVTVIDNVSDLYSVDRHQAMRSRSYYWSLVAGVLNSRVNLLVYLLASRNIRAAFIQSLSKLLFFK